MMKNIKLIVLLVVSFLAFVQDVEATHIIGGNLEYRYIGNDVYEFSLVFRRDCKTGDPDADFDDPAKLYFFGADGTPAYVGFAGTYFLDLNFNPDDTLGNTLISDCGFEGEQVCVQETTYKGQIRLPYREGGYTVVYQRCCRNPTIKNIINPLGTGGSWWVSISEENLKNNNSPSFGEWPSIYICADEPISFDHSAIDVDGDSLVYRLYTPNTGATLERPIPRAEDTKPPYGNIEWNTAGGYGLENVLGSADPLKIDPKTGLLTGTPDFVGQFLVGVAVDEYRDGKLIGTTRRDFQYNVRKCSAPPKADFTANDGNCDGTSVTFENKSVSATKYIWNFNYPSTDSTFISTEENPTFNYSTPGVYDVQLIAIRNTDQCQDEIIKKVTALNSNIQVKYTAEIEECREDGSKTIVLVDKSTDPESGLEITNSKWIIVRNGTFDILNGDTIRIDVEQDSEDILIQLQTTSGTGCSKSIQDTLTAESLVLKTDFEATLSNCPQPDRALLSFENISNSINDYATVVSSSWQIVTKDQTINATGNTVEVLAPHTEVISVTLTTDFGGGCTETITRDVTISDLKPTSAYRVESVQCVDDNTVKIRVYNETASENPNYTVLSSEWSVTAQGTTYDGGDEFIEIDVIKDEEVSIEMISQFDNGCVDTLRERFLPGAFATLEYTRGNPFKICKGDTVAVLSNPNASYTYEWSPIEGLIFDGTDRSNPKLIGGENTTYFVTVSDGFCTVTDSLEVEVLDENSILSVEGDLITCDGSVELVAKGGILDGNFQWAEDASFTTVLYTGDTLRTSFDGAEKTYYVRFTGINCGNEYKAVTVERSKVNEIQFAGNPLKICQGDTVTLLKQYEEGITYTWSPTGGLVFREADQRAYATQAGTYYLEATDGFCTFGRDTVTVEVLNQDAIEIQGDTLTCDGMVELVAVGGPADKNLSWSTDSTFATIIYTGDTLRTAIESGERTYYLQLGEFGCGQSFLSYTVRKSRINDIDLKTNPLSVCKGDTTALLVNYDPSLTYTWTPMDGLVFPEGNDNAYATQGGTYVLEVSEGICKSKKDTLNVILLDDNAVSIEGDSITCDGSVELIAQGPTGPNGRQWSLSPTFEEVIGKGDTLRTSFEGASQTYYLSLEGVGCTKPYASFTVYKTKVNDVQLAGDPLSVCKGDTTALLVNYDPSLMYTWTPTDGLVFPEGNDNAYATQGGTYVLEVSEGICKSKKDTLNVILLDDNAVSIEGDSITCDGSVELIAQGPTGPNGRQWSLSPTFEEVIGKGDTLRTSFEGTSQTYYLSLEGVSCTKPYASFTVYKTKVNDVQFPSNPLGVCKGDTAMILLNYDPNLTYTWTPMDGLVFPEGNDNAYVTTTGTYNVKITEGDCIRDTSLRVYISDLTDFAISGDSVICDGQDEVRLIASGAIGEGTYQWSETSDFSTVIYEGDTLVRPATANTYYVRYSDQTCGYVILSRTISPFDFSLDYIRDWMICAGDSVRLPVVYEGEDSLRIRWEANDHIYTSLDEINPEIGTSVDESDPFILVFTATSSTGCTLTDTINISFKTRPEISVDVTLTECGEKEVCFKINEDFDSFAIWNFGDPESGQDNRSPLDSPCHTFTDYGTYDVVLSNLATVCAFATDTIAVTVNDSVIVDPISISKKDICKGDEVTLSTNSPNYNIEYIWQTEAGDTIAVGKEITIKADSVFNVTVKAVDPNGCLAEQSAEISPFMFAIDDASLDQTFCKATETTLDITVNGNNSGYTFNWGPADCIKSGSDTPNPVVVADSTKRLTLQVTHTATGCTIDTSYLIEVNQLDFDVDVDLDTINAGESTKIFVSNPADDYTYTWSNGVTESEQTVDPITTTTYVVTVTDAQGCTATDSVTVYVRSITCDESDVYIPNAFSPNGDGVNDVLYVRSVAIDEMRMVIYNRWGEEIFTTTDKSVGWDGTYKGKPVEPDAFAYYIDIKCINGKTYSKKGNVSILK